MSIPYSDTPHYVAQQQIDQAFLSSSEVSRILINMGMEPFGVEDTLARTVASLAQALKKQLNTPDDPDIGIRVKVAIEELQKTLEVIQNSSNNPSDHILNK